MEYTDQEDVFNTWIDIVKQNYPSLEITKELMDILSDTFAAGTVSEHLEGLEKPTQKVIDARMH
jgi:hypothetical protein